MKHKFFRIHSYKDDRILSYIDTNFFVEVSCKDEDYCWVKLYNPIFPYSSCNQYYYTNNEAEDVLAFLNNDDEFFDLTDYYR